jgi:hypothetical protein
VFIALELILFGFRFESCSQFLVGSDLVYILNDDNNCDDEQPSRKVSAFAFKPDSSKVAKTTTQAAAVSEINRVKIESDSIGALKESLHEKDLTLKDEFEFPENGWVCSGC